MIDPFREMLIDLPSVAVLLGKNGKRGYHQLWRWCQKGVGGVRLEFLAEGSRLATSREAVDRFFARLTARRLENGGRSRDAAACLLKAGLGIDGQPLGEPAGLPRETAGRTSRAVDEWLGPRRATAGAGSQG